MKALALIFSIVAFCPFLWASNPRGDDLTVAGIVTVTHDFELSPELRTKAIEAREKILKEVRFGATRTNPDGIIVSLEVEDDVLWVTGISISGGDGEYAAKPTEIRTDLVSKPIRANWFSGTLTGYHGAPLGPRVREFGTVFEVREGKITSQNHVRFTIN